MNNNAVSIDAAAQIATLPKPQQKEALEAEPIVRKAIVSHLREPKKHQIGGYSKRAFPHP